jgi:hypothetical protein
MNQLTLFDAMKPLEAVPSSTAKVHNFEERLAYSEAASEEPFWEAVYRKHFPNMVQCVLLQGNHDSQRQGKDRAVHLSNGHVLYIDEKKREKVYNDILLEYISVDTKNKPGWMECDKSIDYLAYAFMPSKTVYFFPWPQLRRAWNYYKTEWQARYKPVAARNGKYTTYCTPVPIDVLRRAVSTASVIKL